MSYWADNLASWGKQTVKSLPLPTNINSDLYQTLECKQDGYYLQSSTGAVLNSKINSLLEAQKTIDIYTQQHASTFYIVLGLELGYHTLALLQNPNITIWVLEPSAEIIKQAFSLQNFTPYFNQNRLCVFYTPEPLAVANLIAQISNVFARLFIHRASYTHYTSLYQQIQAQVDSILEMKKTNIDTIDYFQRLWIPHLLRNLPFYAQYDGVDCLKTLVQGSSCIIVGAGPSLELNINQLKYLPKDKAIIIAVNTVVPRLLKEEIIPDIIVAIDPQNVLLYSFLPLFLSHRRFPILVAEPTLSPAIIRNYAGTIIFSGLPLLQNIAHPPLKPKHRLDVGGSVATVAYSLAVHLQAKNITFLGLDMAYSHNRMHLRGNEQDTLFLFGSSHRFKTWEHFNFKKSSPHTKTLLHTGFNGEDVKIDYKFKTYIDWLENRFSYYSHHFPTINTTQGGIAFKQIANEPFTRVLSSLSKKSLDQMIFKPALKDTTIKAIKENLEQVLVFLHQAQNNLQQAIEQKIILTQNIMDKLLQSEWISIKTQKFFLEIEHQPEKYIQMNPQINHTINTQINPKNAVKQTQKEDIQQVIYTVLSQKITENTHIIQKVLQVLN